jgi:7-cyano-7-deazaguanine synthase in queuosine biosynthesis
MIDPHETTVFIAECGPFDDRRKLSIRLSTLRRKIGVLVSGGLDSAILYYLMRKIVKEPYVITPFVIIRDNGATIQAAEKVIAYINSTLDKPTQSPVLVDIGPDIDPHFQVQAGLVEIARNPLCNKIYMGVIETMPEHSIGYSISKPNDDVIMQYPLKNLNKSHIIELIIQNGLQELFNITHSCVYEIGRCGECNRCNERAWAFSRLGLVDSGTV